MWTILMNEFEVHYISFFAIFKILIFLMIFFPFHANSRLIQKVII